VHRALNGKAGLGKTLGSLWPPLAVRPWICLRLFELNQIRATSKVVRLLHDEPHEHNSGNEQGIQGLQGIFVVGYSLTVADYQLGQLGLA
jgi:hypothetical protein